MTQSGNEGLNSLDCSDLTHGQVERIEALVDQYMPLGDEQDALARSLMKDELLEMIREARLETSISIVKAEHELLFNKLPVGDVDAWQMLMMLKSHLTMLSERIRADEGALAQLSNNNNTEEVHA